MTGWKNHALQVPPVVLYKALGKFLHSLFGTTGVICGAQFFPSCHVTNKNLAISLATHQSFSL